MRTHPSANGTASGVVTDQRIDVGLGRGDAVGVGNGVHHASIG